MGIKKLELKNILEYYRKETVFTDVDIDTFLDVAEEYLSEVHGLFYAENLTANEEVIRFYKFGDEKITVVSHEDELEDVVEIYFNRNIDRISYSASKRELSILFKNNQSIIINSGKEANTKERIFDNRLKEIFQSYN